MKNNIFKDEKINIKNKPFNLVMPPTETGGCSILMVGSGRSGKTTALKYIIDNYMNKNILNHALICKREIPIGRNYYMINQIDIQKIRGFPYFSS